MEDSHNGNDDMSLNAAQTEKVLQFQDLTGIDNFERCKDILSAHNWDFEIAVRFTLDGSIGTPTAERSHTNINNLNIPSSSSHHSSPFDHQLSVNNNTLVNNNTQPPASAPLTIWSFTTRLIAFPFTFVYDTLLSILRFAWTLIRPDPRRVIIDPTGDVIKFITKFEEDYGREHPVFYRGTYGQALNDAKKELRFLLVYLHSDTHQDTSDFCRSVLCNSQIIDFLNHNNLFFWGCSVNYPEGFRASQALRENTYPFLALIVVKNNRMVSVGKFEGRITAEHLLGQLRRCIDDNEASLVAARLDREERNLTQQLRQQQDQAFEESLRADRERERKRDEEKQKKEAEENAKKQLLLEASQRKERLMNLKVSLADRIPPEPPQNDPNCTKIVIKLPNGMRLERRFVKTQSIKVLYYFVFCHDQSPLSFQIRTNFPPRDLPGKPPSLEEYDNGVSDGVSQTDPPTFEECDLGKGAMLFVHDLEA